MPGRLPSPLAANWLFLGLMLGLVYMGVPIQRALGMPGLVISQVLIFVIAPVTVAELFGNTPLRESFRLKSITALTAFKAVLLGLSAWLTGQAMSVVVIYVVQRMGGQVPEFYSILMNAPMWLALLVGALIPAICEEFAFRGYMQRGLTPVGARAAVLLTGLLFGLMHLSLIRLLPLTVLGVLFSAAVQRSGSVLTGMIMHLVNNATALSLAFFAKSRLSPGSEQIALPLGSVVIWGVAGLIGAVSLWGLLSSLTISDPPDESADAPPARRYPLWAELFPLLPALWFASYYFRFELQRVFGGE